MMRNNIYASSGGAKKNPIGFGAQAASNGGNSGQQSSSTGGTSNSVPPTHTQTVFAGMAAINRARQQPPEMKFPPGMLSSNSPRKRVATALQFCGWQMLPSRSVQAKLDDGRAIWLPGPSPGCNTYLLNRLMGELGEFTFIVWSASNSTKGRGRQHSVSSLVAAIEDCLRQKSIEPFKKVLGG